MKTFTKGELKTVVEDNDRRIPSYIASGWKEEKTQPKQKDAADNLTNKAINDVNASKGKEKDSGKNKGKNSGKDKTTAPDKMVNDAIKANSVAITEGEEVDDGLLKKEGE